MNTVVSEEQPSVVFEDDYDGAAFVAPPPLQNVPAPYFRGFGEAIASTAGVEYNTAFLAVQEEIDPLLIADKKNPFTKSAYASLGQLLATVRPIYNKHGFVIKQFAGATRTHGTTTRRWYSVPTITLITHVRSGQWEAIVTDLPAETTTHGFASAMTYGSRIGLQRYSGLGTTDDDGAAAIRSRLDAIHLDEMVEEAISGIERCKDVAALEAWLEQNKDGLNTVSDAGALDKIRAAYAGKKRALTEGDKEPTVEAKKHGRAKLSDKAVA